MATSFVNKAARQNRLRLILSGIQKHLSGVTTVTLGGAQVALADLAKRIQADIDVSDASVQARAKLTEDIQKERASHQDLDPDLRRFKNFVLLQFGDTKDASTTLADFGFEPRKTGKKSLAVKTEAVAKAEATRSARHTMGPKARSKVKGTTAPAANAPPPKAGSTTTS
jgi:hypothetical protein